MKIMLCSALSMLAYYVPYSIYSLNVFTGDSIYSFLGLSDSVFTNNIAYKFLDGFTFFIKMVLCSILGYFILFNIYVASNIKKMKDGYNRFNTIFIYILITAFLILFTSNILNMIIFPALLLFVFYNGVSDIFKYIKGDNDRQYSA